MEHYWGTIPHWFNYEHVFRNIVAWGKDGYKFLEIGVWRGASSAYMGVEIINSGKKITFDAVDSFAPSKELNEEALLGVEEMAIKNLKPLTDVGVVNLIKGYSLDVVKNYEDESLDFVFIDGSHDYDDVKDDILAWLPKVKKTGIIGGHDYGKKDDNACGVQQAVDEIFGKENITVHESTSWIFSYDKNFVI